MQKGRRATPAVVLAAFLSACGGGGGGGAATLSVDPGSLTLTADTRDNTPRASLQARLDGDLEDDAQPYVEFTNSAIQSVAFVEETDSSGRINIRFRLPETLGPGLHRDTITLKICYDRACTQQVRGSPLRVPVTLTVTGESAPEPEPALPENPSIPDGGILSIQSSQTLTHDIADAEYSRALDAIVMVSRTPEPRLYVYDPVSKLERFVALDGSASSALIAVSVSPDGLSANVAFGNRITHVNLNRGGNPFLPAGSSPMFAHRAASSGDSDAPSLPPRAFSASDLVSVGPDTALAFPFIGSGEYSVVRINARTGEGTLLDSAIADAVARLHAGSGTAYATSRGISRSFLGRYFPAGRAEIEPYRLAPSFMNRGLCDNLWLSANGRRIYTACGKTLRTSEYPSQDMSVLGTLALSASGEDRLIDLSDSTQAGQIAAIQGGNRLNLYDSVTTTPIGSYLIPDDQSGRHIFHSADGSRKYLVARKSGDDSYRILTVQ